MNQYSFAGKQVLVTGASGGLGSALCLKLAERGARLVVTSRSIKALNELISSLPDPGRAVAVTADLSRPGEAERLVREALAAAGYLDALFNNAGLGYFALMEEATQENIRHLFELNTFSPLMLTKALVPHLKTRGGGRVVNIVSAAGRVPIPTVGVYGGSKSALAVMANTMRLELEPTGIDVINIYPGTIASSFEENALREEARPGLCPTESCGLPRLEMAEKVLAAAAGPPGEVWLEWQGRWLAAASLIFPKYVDRWLGPIRDKVVKTKSLKKRRWRLLQVESALACNLRCVMCPWQEIREKVQGGGLMSQETWEALRPHLPQVQSVDFTGGGEPLLHPRLARWMAEAKKAGCETGILTNGLLLKKDKARELMDAGVDWVCVSLDGATAEQYEAIRPGSSFAQVTRNLEDLAGLRSGRVPKIMINFVIMTHNAGQLEEIVELAARLGVDQVNFKQCDVVRGEHGRGLGLFASEEDKAVKRLSKALTKACGRAKKLGLQTTAFPFTPTQRPVCDQDPRGSMFIRFDGQAAPCISQALGGPTTFLGRDVVMPEVHYGNVRETDLLKLWETEACRFFRDRFQARVDAYEDTFVQSLTGGARPSHDRLKALALGNMPEAPEGCRVCHYLYDI
ncbi:MAG: SDR family NAD(P)-dependent oxidoreductase [Thermodesulfobacteriota bacterium]